MFIKILIPGYFILSQFLIAGEWNPKKLPNRYGQYIDTIFTINISEVLPDIYVRYREYYMPGRDSHDFGETYCRADLKKTFISEPFQVIEDSSATFASPSEHIDGNMFEDMNFDGFKDLKFSRGGGYGGGFGVNESYDHYLYNPQISLFYKYEELSLLSQPNPDHINLKIYSCSRMNSHEGYAGVVDVYEWQNNKLIHLQNYDYECIDKNSYCHTYMEISGPYCKYRCIKTIFKDNKPLSCDTLVIDGDKIPDEHQMNW